MRGPIIECAHTLDDGRPFHFKVDPERAAIATNAAGPHLFWTQLDYRRCSNCPLKPGVHRHCPDVLDIGQTVRPPVMRVSHHQVNLQVRTDDRTYQKRTDAPTAVRSLMGQCLATGAAASARREREETLFRMAGAYLLRQYFVAREGGTPDWDLKGRNKLYKEIQEGDRWLKQRLAAAAKKDANVNAAVSLVNMAIIVLMSLEEQLNELELFTIGDGR